MTHGILYEVNTRCWLRELSDRAGRRVTLSDVPDAELSRWRALGFTHIWLMGVWQVGDEARQIALQHWRDHWRKEIPSRDEDVQGSPFAVREYALDSRLGETISLLLLKERFAAAGLKLILDFVPNHLGLDSTEPVRYPARFVQSPEPMPGTFPRKTSLGLRHFAHGRDPYFPPWTDTIQLDYRVAETHQAMTAVAQTVSMFGNGLRCDMAMLLLPEIFENTWKDFPPLGAHLTRANFWRSAIPAMRQLQPQLDLIAEVYWDREQDLQDCGFDYTYNKRVADYILRGQFRELRDFLHGCSAKYLRRSVHFLENHDEPRAASVLPPDLHKAAALLILSLPGLAMLHDGQLEGRKAFARIQMNKRADEQPDREISAFYAEVLTQLQTTSIRRGVSEMVPTGADETIAIGWSRSPDEFDITVVNLGGQPRICHLPRKREALTSLYATGGGCNLKPEGESVILQLPPRTGIIFRTH
jgi:hypothetical protein